MNLCIYMNIHGYLYSWVLFTHCMCQDPSSWNPLRVALRRGSPRKLPERLPHLSLGSKYQRANGIFVKGVSRGSAKGFAKGFARYDWENVTMRYEIWETQGYSDTSSKGGRRIMSILLHKRSVQWCRCVPAATRHRNLTRLTLWFRTCSAKDYCTKYRYWVRIWAEHGRAHARNSECVPYHRPTTFYILWL